MHAYFDMFFFYNISVLLQKYTIIEGKGKYSPELHATKKKVMNDLWTEMASLADYNKVCSLKTFTPKKTPQEKVFIHLMYLTCLSNLLSFLANKIQLREVSKSLIYSLVLE